MVESLRWVGCFQDAGSRKRKDQNILPKPNGSTSAACAEACHGYRYILLKKEGHCNCLAAPEASDFRGVPLTNCGAVCASSEDGLTPKRYCGGKEAFAVYRLGSTAIAGTAKAGKAGANPYLWPTWSREHRGRIAPGGHKKEHVMKGISYRPVPLRAHGKFVHEDFMSEATQAMWGSSEGRGDLGIIKSLGANTVRLYGDDPTLDHGPFLHEAMKQGLEVIAGISDYPFTEMPGNCVSTNYNCYHQVKAHYMQNLKRGFLVQLNAYHPALKTVVLINEPERKFPSGLRDFCRAAVSAFDAALDAESELGVVGEAPAFTVTFSFQACTECFRYGQKPAMGQMIELGKAMMHPESVGYHPNNDLWAAYRVRFVNSVNIAEPANDIPGLFLDLYGKEFPHMPVFFGEYHNPHKWDQTQDLQTVLNTAANESTMLQGISFLEYQVRYGKGASAEYSGIFSLDNVSVTKMRIGQENFSAYCLRPVEWVQIAEHMYTGECGAIEEGVDYSTDGKWSVSIDHSPSPDDCCHQCKQNAKCRAWTWVEDAQLRTPGPPSQCLLKGGVLKSKLSVGGVISGVYASADASARRLHAAPAHHSTATALSGGQSGGRPRNVYVHAAVASAFGGPGVSPLQLCPRGSSVATSRTTATPEQTLSWFGCFTHEPGSKYVYSNEKGGFTSTICANGCDGYSYALLHNDGHCSCGKKDPSLSLFSKVEPQACGGVCAGEEGLTPKRYCGDRKTFAIYRIGDVPGEGEDSEEAAKGQHEKPAVNGTSSEAVIVRK